MLENLRETFSKIYDQYIDKIYRFIFLKVNSEEVAQDLTSEVFLRTWQKFSQGKGNPIGNPQAFLYQTARNLVIDYYREKGRIQLVSAEAKPLIDPSQNLEETARQRSDLQMIRMALADLKEDYQNVIIWYYLDDLPISEIAKMLVRTEEATRVLLHRALASLRRKLNST